MKGPRIRLRQRLACVAVVALSTWAGAWPAQARVATDDLTAAADAARAELHWDLVASEDFDGPLSTERWTAYSGKPGCCEDTLWTPDQVRVARGHLVLRNNPDASGTWTSGGVGGWGWDEATRLYGRWDARVRLDQGAGVSATALLWPVEGWPPEVNYFEIFETWPLRDRMAVTTHYLEDQAPGLSQWIVHADFTRWHVVSVRWTATQLAYFVDGIRVLVETDPARIPRTPMWPAFQTHVHRDADGDWPQLMPGRRTVRMQVDWLRVYAPDSTRSHGGPTP